MKFNLKKLVILSAMIMTIGANGEQKRIAIDDVNIRNYEQFIEQLKIDLPEGTSFESVKSYLALHKIKYGYASAESCIKFMRKKVRSSFFIFNTDLQVKIFVSEGAGVKEVKYELIETAL